MCGRYGLEAHYGTSLGGVPLTEPFTSWNIAPTQQVPILLNRRVTRTAQGQLPDAPRRPGVHRLGVSTLDTSGTYREIYRARWGLIPDWHPWDEDPKPPALTFNARSETLFEKASYARPAVTGHCAIPTAATTNGVYKAAPSRPETLVKNIKYRSVSVRPVSTCTWRGCTPGIR